MTDSILSFPFLISDLSEIKSQATYIAVHYSIDGTLSGIYRVVMLRKSRSDISVPSTSARALSDLDWNFDAVPDKELVACCYWEYARESAFIRETLHQYREWFLGGGIWDEHTGKLSANLEEIQSIGYPSEVFIRGCGFPAEMIWQSEDPEKPNYRHPEAPPITGRFPAPWQSLSEDERHFRARIQNDVEQLQIVPIKLAHWSWAKEIVRECQGASDKLHKSRRNWEKKFLRRDAKGNLFTVPNAPEPPQVEMPRPRTRWGVAETLLVDIAWECFTNDEISNYFRKWVKRARPKDIPGPDSKGRNKARDRRANLTRLAVMRLLFRFTASGIIGIRQNSFPAIWETKQFAGRKWADTTKWYDARREAGQLFHKLFPFLPINEKPLSWDGQAPGK